MAGGENWWLEDKADELVNLEEPKNDGSGESRYFRYHKTTFTICTNQHVVIPDINAGDLGQTAGSIVFTKGNVTHSRISFSGSQFVCTADGERRIATASKYYARTQSWAMIGPVKEYDPLTGEDL